MEQGAAKTKQKKVRILFVGCSDNPIHSKAMYERARKRDDVEAFYLDFDFVYREGKSNNPFVRAENKLSIGPHIAALNHKFISIVNSEKIDMVFLYTARNVWDKTVKRLRDMDIYVAIYNNDNPFALYYPRYFWRFYRSSIKYSNIAYIFRKSNYYDCKRYGAKRIKMLRAYYNRERTYPLDTALRRDVPEVVFLGHIEKDERTDYIRHLLDNGIRVGVPDFHDWRNEFRNHSNIVYLKETHDKYNEILNKAKIALVFLSKINEDTYTRRCFEIPSVKTMMLSVYTKDMASMFVPDKEAVYYRNKDELLDKVKKYLEDDEDREIIAQAGYDRLMKDGQELDDRIDTIIGDYLDYNRR